MSEQNPADSQACHCNYEPTRLANVSPANLGGYRLLLQSVPMVFLLLGHSHNAIGQAREHGIVLLEELGWWNGPGESALLADLNAAADGGKLLPGRLAGRTARHRVKLFP